MKFNSWQFVTVVVVALFGLFLIQPANGFTTPAWPPLEGDQPVFTTPDWPPNTTPAETTEDTTLTPDTTTSTAAPPPGENAAEDETNAWMIVGIIFIVLTVVLAIVAIYLYVSISDHIRPFRSDKTFVLPRVNP